MATGAASSRRRSNGGPLVTGSGYERRRCPDVRQKTGLFAKGKWRQTTDGRAAVVSDTAAAELGHAGKLPTAHDRSQRRSKTYSRKMSNSARIEFRIFEYSGTTRTLRLRRNRHKNKSIRARDESRQYGTRRPSWITVNAMRVCDFKIYKRNLWSSYFRL